MSSEVLRLLVLEASLEDAENLMRQLRNAGLATRPVSAETVEDLERVLEKQQLDLLLVNTELDDDFSIANVSSKVAAAGRDLPLIALIDEYSAKQRLEAMKAGATAAIPAEDFELLERVARRELEHLGQRRRLRFLEAGLNETERRISALLDSSKDAIAYVHEGMHVYANPAYLELFDYDDFEELEGLPILDMVTGNQVAQLKEILRDLSKGKAPPDHIEIALQLPDASTKPAIMEFTSASIEGEPCTQVVLRDKTVSTADAAELRELKSRDLVTGLFNRTHLVELLDQGITQVAQGGPKQTLLMLALDNFKAIKDQVGLAGLDLILRDFADQITANMKEGDVAARISDQTFVLLSKTSDLPAAEEFANRLCKIIADHIAEAGGQSISTTCSIGATIMAESITRARDLLSLAETATLAAQEAGGNRVQVYDPLQSKPTDDDSLRWLEIVRDALTNDRMYVAYQPIVSLHGEPGDRYECYLRGKAKDGEEMKPGEFIKAVRDDDIMIELDHWMLDVATRTLREHMDSKPGMLGVFFVKLSPQTISHPKTLPLIAKAMQSNRLSGENVIFEIAETSVMSNLKATKAFLKGLQQLHCKSCIEQYGSGLNSAQVLKHVSTDMVKIDRGFVADLSTNQDNQAKIREICTEMKGLGKTTIVEFVEDAASMSILWQCGAEFVQGNFLQEPLPELNYEFD